MQLSLDQGGMTLAAPPVPVEARVRSCSAHVARWCLALPALLLLAATLRAVAACQPGFHHPDAIFQYLEPAFRLVTGQGVVTWEWRVGMRSWLLPALLAGPVALGEAIDPHSALPMILPRLTMGAASLGIVWAAWSYGLRHDRTTALLAGFVAAVWFEFIHLGIQTLAEPLAAAAFMVASVWLTKPGASTRERFAAGFLLAMMVLLRPHYGPAGLVLAAVAWWPLRSRPALLARLAAPVVIGAFAMATIGGTIDVLAGGWPFAWIVENVRQNVVEHVAARYGLAPPLALIAWLVAMWQWGIVPIAIGVRFGWRQAPGLVAAALVTILIHSLIGHKEYRFIFLAVTALLVVSAIGWGVVLAQVRQRWPDRARIATAALFVGWGAASIALACGPDAHEQREAGVAGSRLVADLRADRGMCGLAIVYQASFADIPGQVGLGPNIPQSMFWSNDPHHPSAMSWAEAARNGAGFNRILSSDTRPGTVPPTYRKMRCEPYGPGAAMCIYARPGGCRLDPASPYLMNRGLIARGA